MNACEGIMRAKRQMSKNSNDVENFEDTTKS